MQVFVKTLSVSRNFDNLSTKLANIIYILFCDFCTHRNLFTKGCNIKKGYTRRPAASLTAVSTSSGKISEKSVLEAFVRTPIFRTLYNKQAIIKLNKS